MDILIIEDEIPAFKRLALLVSQLIPKATIFASIDSIETAVEWFKSNPSPDLIFMDIQLADGLSFDIFNQIKIEAPVVFTTAYDQYAIKAFKVNSIDYLLKPIDTEELKQALEKYNNLYQKQPVISGNTIQQLIQSLTQPEYKERFIVKVGQQLTYINVTDIYYFYSEDGLVFARTAKGKKHAVDYTLDQLEELTSPSDFFRINRKIITRIEAIHKIAAYFNSRLKLELRPLADFDVIVSRDRVPHFKKWLDKWKNLLKNKTNRWVYTI